MNLKARMRADDEPVHGGNLPPDWWLFFTKFLRQGSAIASFVPSSQWLACAVVEDIDFANAQCVVELGAGTGPITAQLLACAGKSCRVLIVERDVDFCRRLRERFVGADIVQADACDLDRHLATRGITSIDHVLCGLPLPSFRPTDRDHILEVVRQRLAAHGTFRQLTHMPWVYYPLYRRYFETVRFHLVFRNLPPAGFYVCRVPKPVGQQIQQGPATLHSPA
jgi:phospholipid N-methyltransferase